MQSRLFSHAYQSGTPTFLFNIMQISEGKKEFSCEWSMQADILPTLVCPPHTAVTHTLTKPIRNHSGSTLNISSLLRGQLHCQKPRQVSSWMK